MGWNQFWTVVEFKDELHVIPINDTAQHRTFGCWCKPTFDPDKRALSPVYVHHAADKRELVEERDAFN